MHPSVPHCYDGPLALALRKSFPYSARTGRKRCGFGNVAIIITYRPFSAGSPILVCSQGRRLESLIGFSSRLWNCNDDRLLDHEGASLALTDGYGVSHLDFFAGDIPNCTSAVVDHFCCNPSLGQPATVSHTRTFPTVSGNRRVTIHKLHRWGQPHNCENHSTRYMKLPALLPLLRAL